MLKIHEEAHRSARFVLQKSRSTAWVVKGKSLAERVVEESQVKYTQDNEGNIEAGHS